MRVYLQLLMCILDFYFFYKYVWRQLHNKNKNKQQQQQQLVAQHENYIFRVSAICSKIKTLCIVSGTKDFIQTCWLEMILQNKKEPKKYQGK